MKKSQLKEIIKEEYNKIINEMGDPTNYELELGNNTKFSFNKNTDKIFLEQHRNSIMIHRNEFKRMVYFAEKNGLI
jgi:hypothetical protein